VDVDEGANGTRISLPAGDSLALRLVENPTTGFRWTLVRAGEPALVPVGDETVAATGPPGSSGYHRWRFEARQPGQVTVELAYRRSWETTQLPARVFHLEVAVV
jgi:inhibitor of cysteine peptidase